MLIATGTVLLVVAAAGQNVAPPAAKTNASAYLAEGIRLSRANKPEEALKAFQQAGQLDPDNEQAVLGQYVILTLSRRMNEGSKILNNEDVTGLNDAAFAVGMEIPTSLDAPGT